jgi:hypothetical protein
VDGVAARCWRECDRRRLDRAGIRRFSGGDDVRSTAAALVDPSVDLRLQVVWAAWHLPLFFYPGWISASPIQYLLIVVGLGVLLAFGANLARFSVIAPILMHAMFNTSSRFLNGLFAGTHTEPHPPMPFEMVMGLCGLAVAGVVVAVTRGRLAYRRPLSSLDADYVEHRG